MSYQEEIKTPIEVDGKKVEVRYSDKIFCTRGCTLFKEGRGCQYGVDKCSELDIWNGGYTAEKYAYFVEAEPEADLDAEIDRAWQEEKKGGKYVDGSFDDFVCFQHIAHHFAEWGAEHLKK